MSGSLAGGLLPLGNRAGSGSAGSKSTLTGGLIPLTSAKPTTASFRNEPQEGGGRWDQQEQESEQGREGVSGGSRSEKKVGSVNIYCNGGGTAMISYPRSGLHAQEKKKDIQIQFTAVYQQGRAKAHQHHLSAPPPLSDSRAHVRAKHCNQPQGSAQKNVAPYSNLQFSSPSHETGMVQNTHGTTDCWAVYKV